MHANNLQMIEDIQQANAQCTLCSLRQQATQVVVGNGPTDAQIMVIGEAPGAEEDDQGKPFVGASGEFLDEILSAAGVKRSDLYIHNVLSCRPPDNKFPDNEAPNICRRWPLLEIEAIKPKVVVLLGAQAAKYILGEVGTIKHKIGQYKELVTSNGYSCLAVVMYHPSYLMRRGKDFEEYARAIRVWSDIAQKLPGLPSSDDASVGEQDVESGEVGSCATDVFAQELREIADPLIREWCVLSWDAAPDYAYTAPASMSGKYHPAFALGEGGLVRHTKAVVYVVRKWCERLGFTADEKDCLVASALMHDIVKYGDTYGDKSQHSYQQYKDHPSISADHVLEHMPLGISTELAARIVTMVRRHMGQWGAEPPVDKMEKLLHLADMLVSSRELCLDIFTENDFVHEEDYHKAALPPRNVDVTVARKSTPEWFTATFRPELAAIDAGVQEWLRQLWGRVGNVSVWDILLTKRLSMLAERTFDLITEDAKTILRVAAIAQPQHGKIIETDKQDDFVADVIDCLVGDDANYEERSTYPPQRMMLLINILAEDPAWDYRIDERVFE
jgi:uracil-DNA glycosylase family 4